MFGDACAACTPHDACCWCGRGMPIVSKSSRVMNCKRRRDVRPNSLSFSRTRPLCRDDLV